MGRVLRRVGRVRGRAERSERGAALVEAALILPLVLLIVFGALEFSSLYKDAAVVSSAARAGGRIASAEPRNGQMPVDVASAVATAISNLPATSPQQLIVYDGSCSDPTACANSVSFTWNSSTKSWNTGSYTAPGWIASQNVCTTNDSQWARIGVYVKAQHPFITGLFGTGASKTLTSKAVFRVEPVPSLQCS
ncbi:MAG TPA: TadE/TadG family type IV pilus assembly protein [Acidimicrobiia bacterium]|jgi:Flp pilus assembly protein TadG